MEADTGRGEPIYRGIGAFALAIGLAALFAPRTLLRVYGVDPDELTGAGEMGWRLFAVRQVLVAAAALSGDRRARDGVLIAQGPDLVIFAHCYRTRSVPRPTAVLAMLSAGGVAVLSAYARTRS